MKFGLYGINPVLLPFARSADELLSFVAQAGESLVRKLQ